MRKNIMMFLAAVSILAACKGIAEPVFRPVSTVDEQVTEAKVDLPEGWKEITADDGFIIMMPYADTGNFTHQKIYDCARCLLRTEVAEALVLANEQALNQGRKIVIYDCYRPLPYQQKMFDVVPDKRYVADPAKGSMHNRGCAVDVGLADSSNKLLDMGTGFDDFSPKAAYSFAALTKEQQKNRETLRKLMLMAGFEPYEKEWWHFNNKKKNYPLSDYTWPCN